MINRHCFWLLSLLLIGCASKDTVIPPSDHTMQEIYESHMGNVRGEIAGAPRVLCSDGVASWTRELANDNKNLFPRLRNPDLVMYVFPHLSDSGAPVPGYATVFPMYEQVEYALPGEDASGLGDGCP